MRSKKAISRDEHVGQVRVTVNQILDVLREISCS
jgi:hypothetical protein